MNLLDWAIIICLVLGAFRGLRRGLIRSLLGLAGLILGLVLASQFYRPLTQYLETSYAWVTKLGAGLAPHLPLAATVSSIPANQGTVLTDAIQSLTLPSFVTHYLLDSTGATASLPPTATVGQALSYVLASAIIGVVCFVAIFLVTQLAVTLLSGMFSRAVSVTPLGILDHLAGLALGVGWSAIILTLLLGGLGLLTSVPAFAFLQPAIDGSKLAPTFISVFEFLLPRVPVWLGTA